MLSSLKLTNVKLGYRRQPVVKDVSFELGTNEVVGLIGPNGSGKSTLLKAMSGLLHLFSGSITLDGRELAGIPRETLACHIGVVPQLPALPEGFTVFELVLMGRYPHLGLMRHESKQDIAVVCNALKCTGLEHLTDRLIGEISGGERQRVVIARAIAQEPRFLLLDEPTAHLDIHHQLEVMELATSLANSGLGIAIALHDFSLASRFCHRLLMLKAGSIFKAGTAKEVMTTENIRQVFGVTAMIYSDLSSSPLVVHTATSGMQPGNHRRRIHIIGGGGSAASIMHHLHNEGYCLTSGVLNQGDTDLSAARALGIEAVVIPAFAAIDDAAHQRNLELAAQADYCIVTNVAFGWANLRNLEAAAVAAHLVLVDDVPVAGRDFTANRASEIYNTLKHNAQCIKSADVPVYLKTALQRDEVSKSKKQAGQIMRGSEV